MKVYRYTVLKLEKETPRAIALRFQRGNPNTDTFTEKMVWFPKSLVKIEKKGRVLNIDVPEWLVINRGVHLTRDLHQYQWECVN